ncbi:MAG: AI-2E family transporter [Betaproteobacteria bacterium]|jgi:predicted PurR-regulated permease PerM
MPSQPSDPSPRNVLSHPVFVLLVVGVSALFAWIVWPFYGAILWAAILAVLFQPVYRRVANALRQRKTLAALATLFVILAVVVLPTALVAAMLVQETRQLYDAIQSGELDLAGWFQRVSAAMPAWTAAPLERFGLTDVASLRAQISDWVTGSARVLAAQAVNIGHNTIDLIVNLFIMLYLAFFFLRNGDTLLGSIERAVPLPRSVQDRLLWQFTNTTRAIVKGSLVVAMAQGMLGGIIFWILGIGAPVFWGVVMAFLSLLPAVGAAVVWAPVALYLLATGAIWKGLGLLAYGVLVIGLVDNVLRPVLVGSDTKIPDYVILITTLGGIAVMGVNGLVVGPLIAAMFISIWSVVAESRTTTT